MPLPLLKPTYEKLPLTSQPLSMNHSNPAFTPFLLAEGLSSMETLLINIQVIHCLNNDDNVDYNVKTVMQSL